MSKKIIAIVVTHNRCHLLKRCVEYIKKQERPVDEILIINNGSNDGTLELLNKMDVSTITQANVGSAGGWHTGLNYAIQRRYDYAWLMDDDGYPDTSSLKNLTDALRNNMACISSVVIQENTKNKFVFPVPLINREGFPKVFSIKRKVKTLNGLRKIFKGNLYPFAHLFNGALVKIEAVNQIGNVNENFFMFGDEVDYFFRLREYGPVLTELNSFHYHPDVTKRKYSSSKIYYYIKNSLVLNRRYFDLKKIRNILVIIAIINRTAKRNGLFSLMKLLFGYDRRSFYPAINRGLQGKVGKDYNV